MSAPAPWGGVTGFIWLCSPSSGGQRRFSAGRAPPPLSAAHVCACSGRGVAQVGTHAHARLRPSTNWGPRCFNVGVATGYCQLVQTFVIYSYIIIIMHLNGCCVTLKSIPFILVGCLPATINKVFFLVNNIQVLVRNRKILATVPTEPASLSAPWFSSPLRFHLCLLPLVIGQPLTAKEGRLYSRLSHKCLSDYVLCLTDTQYFHTFKVFLTDCFHWLL